ncbi:MAG TPA: Ig-like domain-containing protein, partial [bacterium]
MGQTLVVAARDEAGNLMRQPLTLTYTIDSTRSAASYHPEEGSTIATTDPVVITFNQAMDPTTLVLDGSMAGQADGGVFSSVTNENDTLTLSPVTAWSGGTQTLSIEISAAAGGGFSSGTVDFEVDDEPPYVVASTPADGAEGVAVNLASIAVVFSESMDPTTAPALAFSPVYAGTVGAPVWSTTTFENDTATFKLSQPLNSETDYTVTVGVGADMFGNVMLPPASDPHAPNNRIRFTTETAYALSVAGAGTGTGRITGTGGIDCGTVCSAELTSGSMAVLTATPDAGSTFMGWQGDINPGTCWSNGQCIVTMDAAKTVTAVFTANPVFTAVMNGPGSVTSIPLGIQCSTVCAGTFLPNTIVSLIPLPESGATFMGWSGDGCGGLGICTVLLTGARTVTATFARNRNLTVSRVSNSSSSPLIASGGNGSVASSPAGIDCGSFCARVFAQGTVITLTATPTAGSVFTGWSGGGCSGTGTCQVTLAEDTAVSAAFTPQTQQLSVSNAGNGTGTVISSPAAISCGSVCSKVVPANVPVTLTATPTGGATFAGWSGGGCSGTGTCQVAMATDTAVTATFTKNDTLPLTLVFGGSGAGRVESASPTPGVRCIQGCNLSYTAGSAVTLTATGATGSIFTGWTGGGCSGTGTCVVTMNEAKVLTASFGPASVSLGVGLAGTATGTVTSSPAGISCGAACGVMVAPGTSVTLSAAPAPDATFAGWSGNGGCSGTGTCTVKVTDATYVTANFTAQGANLL